MDFRTFRHTIRGLIATRASTGFVVTVLILVIGVNTAVFTLVNSLLISPLPYAMPDQLVAVWETEPQVNPAPVTEHDFQRWQAQSKSFSALAAYETRTATLSGLGEAATVTIVRCSPALGSTLQTAPAMGVWLADRPQAAQTAVVSYGFWQRFWAGRKQVNGESIVLNQQEYTIVGVMPQHFSFPSPGVDVWIPLQMALDPALQDAHYLNVVGRLERGESLRHARDEMTLIAARLRAETPKTNANVGVDLRSLRDIVVGDRAGSLLMLQLCVGLVLLAGCANVITITAARTMSRSVQIGTQLALGASPGDLFRQFATEAVLLAVAGTAGGAWLSRTLLSALQPVIASYAPQLVLQSGQTVFIFLAAVCAVVTLVCGVAPVLYARRVNVADVIKQGVPGSSGAGRSQRKTFQALVILEISVATVLLMGSAMTIKSFLNLIRIDCGIDPRGVTVARIAFPEKRYQNSTQLVNTYEQLIARTRRELPMAQVAFTNDVPVAGTGINGPIQLETGSPVGANPPQVEHVAVTEDFFSVLGMPIKAGRGLAAQDFTGNYRVVVIDEAMARAFWPGKSPVGRRISLALNDPPEWREIVGVVGAVKYFGVRGQIQPAVYIPFSQMDGPYAALLLRSGAMVLREPSQGQGRAAAALRSALREIDPVQPLGRVETMESIIENSAENSHTYAILLAIFALPALAIAFQGIFAVTTFTVSSTERNLAIRVAMGASRPKLRWMVVRTAFRLTAIGLAVGLAASAALFRFLAGVTYGVSTVELDLVLLTCGVFVVIAVLAALFPANRAVSVDPMMLLR